MALGYYILSGRNIVQVEDVHVWARWFETADRHVGDTTVGTVRVSTVFLGLDHNFSDHGPPKLFETMVFSDGLLDGETARYSTWEEAEAGHAKMVQFVRDVPKEPAEKT